MEPATPRQPSRTRIVIFRIAVVLFFLFGLVGANLVLIMPLLSWLPEATWIDTIGYPEEDIHHLVHGAAIGLWYGVLLLCLAVQVRRPQRSVAPLWVIAFIVLAQIGYDLVNLDIGDAIWFLGYALFAAVLLLHPRRTARVTVVDRPALVLAVAAAVPLVVTGWSQLRLQFGPADPFGHADQNHFFTMAGLSGLIIATALLGSTGVPGRRLVAWVAGVAAVLFAVASLAHPDQSSAWPVAWAAAAVAWGVGYVLAVEWGRRHLRGGAGEVMADRAG